MQSLRHLKTIFFKFISAEKRNVAYNFFTLMTVYYVISLVILFKLPFLPGLIPLLFLPTLFFGTRSTMKEAILAEIFFLIVFYSYVFGMKGSGLAFRDWTFVLVGTIFALASMHIINRFSYQLRNKQKELSNSMTELAASYRNLEANQTKLVALTTITRKLLRVQEREKVIPLLINLLQRYIFYEHIAYFSLKDGEVKLANKLGYLNFKEDTLVDLIAYYHQNYSDSEVETISAQEICVELMNQSEIDSGKFIFLPVKAGGELEGYLLSYHLNSWIQPEDEDVMRILGDQLDLILSKLDLLTDTRQLAITDSGTKLYNQRYFYDKLATIFEHSKKYKKPMTVAIFDIDNFKELNDKYGHLFGDLVLEEIANMMLDNVRGIDVLARYGGDEFVLILPETGRKKGLDIAKRIVEKVDAYQFFTNSGEEVTTSLSGGVAAYPEDEIDDPVQLVELADSSLYISKQAGKNTVVCDQLKCRQRDKLN